MTSAERVRTALSLREPDRVPIHDSPWRATLARWHREGLPEEISGATELGESLRAFYQRSDFTLFGAAYSLFFDTDESLATLLNGAMSPDTASLISGKDEHRRIHANGWFEKLVQRGYQIRVYQSDYLDFCNAKDVDLTYCFTYPANSIRSIAFVGTAK